MADQLMSAASELSVLVPELWSKKFYPTLKERLPMIECVAHDYEGDIQALGDTVNITKFPQFDAAEDLAETAAADAEALTATQSQLVINHQYVKDYIVTLKGEVQAMDAAQHIGDLAVFAIMKKMHSGMLTAIVPSSSSPDHQISFSSGTTLALADLLAIKDLLDLQDVEEAGRKIVGGVAQQNDLLNVTTFTSADYVGGEVIASGKPGKTLLGFDMNWTSEAGNTVYGFHPLFMQAAVQRAPKVGVYDLGGEGKRATRFNFTVLCGEVQVDNLRVVKVS